MTNGQQGTDQPVSAIDLMTTLEHQARRTRTAVAACKQTFDMATTTHGFLPIDPVMLKTNTQNSNPQSLAA